MAYVSLQAFIDRYENTVPSADMARIQALLDDACALVSDVAGIVYQAAVTVPAGTGIPPTAVVAVVCSVVRRAYENPAGLESETIGDYTWRGAVTGSGVYLTPDEKRIVRRAAGKLGVGALTMTSYLPVPAVDPRISTYYTAEDEL